MIILTIILLFPLIYICILMGKKRKSDISKIEKKSECKSHVVTSKTHDDIISSTNTEQSLYELKMITIQKSINSFLKEKYGENFVSWNCHHQDRLLLENPVIINVHTLKEVRTLILEKIPTINGFDFVIVPNVPKKIEDIPENEESPTVTSIKAEIPVITEEEPATITAENWINEHLEEIEALRKKCINENKDFFLYKESIPDTIKEVLQETLEIKGIFLQYENEKNIIYI